MIRRVLEGVLGVLAIWGPVVVVNWLASWLD